MGLRIMHESVEAFKGIRSLSSIAKREGPSTQDGVHGFLIGAQNRTQTDGDQR